ncbi:MAG: TonB family protein [Hyphomonadaceae bacterium]
MSKTDKRHVGQDIPGSPDRSFLRKNFSRFALSAAPAALATAGLFLIMDRMITTDEVHLAEAQTYALETITPQYKDMDARPTKRTPPQKLPDAVEPPPPPKLSTNKANIDLPTPTIQGAAPEEVGFGKVAPMEFGVPNISDISARPIRPPVPEYPRAAAERGLEGNCDVSLDVDVRGRPYNIKATCTDSVFVRSAERAVSKVQFAAKIVRGQAAERHNVVYPLVYQIEE